MTPCPSCHHVHCAAWVTVVGRFQPVPTGYRAATPGAPVRATRVEAETDACAAMSGGNA